MMTTMMIEVMMMMMIMMTMQMHAGVAYYSSTSGAAATSLTVSPPSVSHTHSYTSGGGRSGISGVVVADAMVDLCVCARACVCVCVYVCVCVWCESATKTYWWSATHHRVANLKTLSCWRWAYIVENSYSEFKVATQQV
jgi:hypothetical protein